jgi:hypothetical protein
MRRDVLASFALVVLLALGLYSYLDGRSSPGLLSSQEAAVYRQSYRHCERVWGHVRLWPEHHPVEIAWDWADSFDHPLRTAARAGCLDALKHDPPQV